ncbi:response regulator transcription factor [Bradyrhizobium sp.]|uniref:response regulator n=1 Tax=Bradyrhizobium sp. TaxID=376 RepID=UPI001D963162|nr:response regulator transcription factor [Bradyrhizobium sp.]MBI5320897.1 response regulator transcription factor [Bradyrhizobium sp.]
MAVKRASIVLADDHPFILLALKQLIAAEADLELVGEAVTGIDALSLVRSITPDIAVIDVAMPGMSGILLTRKIREERPTVKVLILTAHEDEGHVKQALSAGACGFLLKRSATTTLIPAVRAALAGGTFIDPLLAGRSAQGAAGAVELSPREREALRLTALGYATKEIAKSMGIGGKSVETYRGRALEKLGLKSRAEIVKFAVSEGWLT